MIIVQIRWQANYYKGQVKSTRLLKKIHSPIKLINNYNSKDAPTPQTYYFFYHL